MDSDKHASSPRSRAGLCTPVWRTWTFRQKYNDRLEKTVEGLLYGSGVISLTKCSSSVTRYQWKESLHQPQWAVFNVVHKSLLYNGGACSKWLVNIVFDQYLKDSCIAFASGFGFFYLLPVFARMLGALLRTIGSRTLYLSRRFSSILSCKRQVCLQTRRKQRYPWTTSRSVFTTVDQNELLIDPRHR